MSYTKGPWRYHHDKYEGDAILASDKPIKWVVRRFEDPDTGYDVVDIPNEADAHLIAAAPCLLEALDGLWMWCRKWGPGFMDDDEFPEYRAKIETALRKAKGETQ